MRSLHTNESKIILINMGSCFQGACPASEIASDKYREKTKEPFHLNSITCEVCLYLFSRENHQKMLICPLHEVCKVCKQYGSLCQMKQFCSLCEYLDQRQLIKRKEIEKNHFDSQVTTNQRLGKQSIIKREGKTQSKIKQADCPFQFDPSLITLENGKRYIKAESGNWGFVVLKKSLLYGAKQELKLTTNQNANLLIGVTNKLNPNYNKDNLYGLCLSRECYIIADRNFHILNKLISNNSILSMQVDLKQNKEITFSQCKDDSTDSSIKESEKASEIICSLMIPESMLKGELYIFIALSKKEDYFEVQLD